MQACEVTSTIEQPVEAVWDLMSALERLTEWMPGMESCTVPEDTPKFPEYGAVRVVKLKGSEANYNETLEIFDAKNHFTSYVVDTGDSSNLWQQQPRALPGDSMSKNSLPQTLYPSFKIGWFLSFARAMMRRERCC